MVYTQTPAVAPTMAGTTTIVYSAVPAGGLAVLPGSIVLVKNGSGSSITVTINVAALKKYKGYSITSPTVTVAAGAEVPLGPIPGELHQIINPADANNGYVLLDFSAVTTVTAAVINVPQ
jgi:hypothetical protein